MREQAWFIGGLFGQAHLDQLAESDVDDVVQHADFRSKLRTAYDAATADVGEKKATKVAVRSARDGATSYTRLGPPRNQGRAQGQAEQAIRDMLGL